MKQKNKKNNYKLGSYVNPKDKGYNNFKLSLPKNLQYEGDYDLKGYYSKYGNRNAELNGHLTDEFKLPNHNTFSEESKYFNGNTMHQAGYWNGSTYIPYNPNRPTLDEETGKPWNILSKRSNSKYDWGSFVKSDTSKLGAPTGQIGNMIGGAIGGSTGNVVSGVASGAMAGASLGPIGMGVGALIGGGVSLLGNKKAKETAINQRAEDYTNSKNAYSEQFNSELDTDNQNAYGNLSYAKGSFVDPIPKKITSKQDKTKVNYSPRSPTIINQVGQPIKQRDDFEDNFLSRAVVGNRDSRKGFGKYTDLWKYYSGQPLDNNILSISGNTPNNSKDKNAKYVSINDTTFNNQVVNNYKRVSKGNFKSLTEEGLTDPDLIKKYAEMNSEQKTGDSTYNISGYGQKGGGVLGHYTVSKGKDNKGDYISYYDKFDASPGKGKSIHEMLGLGKPFEIYDRVYIDKNGNAINKSKEDTGLLNKLINSNTKKFAIGGEVIMGDPIKPIKSVQDTIYTKKGNMITTQDMINLKKNGLDFGNMQAYGEYLDTWASPVPNANIPNKVSPQVKQAIQQNQSNYRYQPKKGMYSTRGEMANGAEVMDNIINIEKGELQIDPESGKIIREYTGMNPETGGLYTPHSKGKDTKHNFVNANPGTFIITTAESKKYKDAVINNDKLFQNSILQNIKNYKDKVAPKAKMADGSFVDPNDPYPVWQSSLNTLNNPASGASLTQPYTSNVGISGKVQMGGVSPINNTGSNFNVNGVLGQLANYAPSLYNIGQGLFGKVDKTNLVNPTVNPYKSQILNNMPEDMSLDPIRQQLMRNQNTQFNQIDNSTSSNPIARANKQNVFANTQNQLGNFAMQVQGQNNQIRSQRASIYQGLANQDVQAKDRAQQINLGIEQQNLANKGAKQQLLDKGLGQLQQVYQNDKLNKSKQGIDKYKIDILHQMFPNLKYYKDFDYATFAKQIGIQDGN